jgi:hypothetical protein
MHIQKRPKSDNLEFLVSKVTISYYSSVNSGNISAPAGNHMFFVPLDFHRAVSEAGSRAGRALAWIGRFDHF